MTDELKQRIQTLVEQNRVMVFMKGNKLMPMCGFSAAVVSTLQEIGVPFATVDVLQDPELRDGIKTFSSWPTIPQVYVDGKFIGGSDIVLEMHERGELEPLMRSAATTDA